MTDPLISVLVPAYNRADTIEKCVRSALDNGYKEIQVIIADNGSSDNTLAKATALASEDPRVEVVSHAHNMGPMANWRSCLERAQGELIHWLWSDDWVEAGFYRTLVDGMKQHRASMALSAVRMTDPEAGWSQIVCSYANRPTTGLEFRRMLMRGGSHSPVSPACALLPRGVCADILNNPIPRIDQLDGESRAIGADALMIIDAAQRAEAVFLSPEPLVCFRSHGNSITLSTGQRSILAHYAWARIWWARQHAVSLSDQFKDFIYLLLNKSWHALARALAYRFTRSYRRTATR